MNNKVKPFPITRLEVLISRLPRSFPNIHLIYNDMSHLYEKYDLKQQVDYYLKYLPKDFIIINDLHLKNSKKFQLDYLILTPHALFIIQVANSHLTSTVTAHLYEYDSYYRFKAKRTQTKLLQWLRERHLNHLPIYYLTVINHFSTLLINKNTRVNKDIILAKQLPTKINKFYKHIQQTNNRNDKVINKIVDAINVEKVNCYFNIFKHYEINKNILLTGVRCSQCYKLRMNLINTYWKCPHCNIKLKDAHKEALSDYFILMNKPISKRECKWFLNIHSSKDLMKMLKEAKHINQTLVTF